VKLDQGSPSGGKGQGNGKGRSFSIEENDTAYFRKIRTSGAKKAEGKKGRGEVGDNVVARQEKRERLDWKRT